MSAPSLHRESTDSLITCAVFGIMFLAYAHISVCLFYHCLPQTGDKVDSVVYPGVVYASIHLDPGDVACSSADSTSCGATVTSEGVYNVNLTLTNDVGSSQPELDMFDCE